MGGKMQDDFMQSANVSRVRLHSETRADGSILIRQEESLPDGPRCMTERFLIWLR